MNNGAFGENFPYSNFHDLNMDWIIKIAKDFLDQYSHIQEIIENGEQSLQDLTTSGLEQLQEKADNLETLLQNWYNSHSEDIANQLASAIADLNEWYTTHENYLDQTVLDNIASFDAHASAELARVLESIPDDYTTLAKAVEYLKYNENVQSGTNLFDIETWLTSHEVAYTRTGNIINTTLSTNLSAPYVFAQDDMPIEISGIITAGTVTNPEIRVLNKQGTVVATLNTSNRYATGNGCMVTVNFGSGGTVTLDNVVIKNRNLTNKEFTKTLALYNSTDYNKNILNLDEWFDECNVSFTKSGNEYTAIINNRVAYIPCRFSPYEIPVTIKGDIRPNGGTLPILLFYNNDDECVGIYTPNMKELNLTASYMLMGYGNAGSMKLNITITKTPEAIYQNAECNELVLEPENFAWKTSPVHGKIFTDGKGNFQIKDFNISDNMYPVEQTFYVDNYHGNDNNDGLSWVRAFKTIEKAYNSISVAGTIILAPSVYKRTEGTWAVNPIRKYINLISWGGQSYLSNDWTGDRTLTDGLITFPTAIVPFNVVDLANKDADGNYIIFEQKQTIAEVQNTPGSWISNNNILYVNPLSYNWNNYINIVITRSSDGNAVVEGATRFYAENVSFIGGTSPFKGQASDSTHAPNIYMKNCEFWYGQGDASGRNALTIMGCRNVILESCRAMCNYASDGFNYHDYQNYSPRVIEINCVGMYNGNAEDGADQGSTIHESGKIIRINGIYAYNFGANIADDSENAQSWNLGCVCHNSKSPFPSQNSNFLSYNAKMWIDGCSGYSSEGNIAGDASSIYLRNPRFYGELKSPQTTGNETIY